MADDNNIQNEVFKTFELLFDNMISNQKIDTAIKATIKRVVSVEDGEYEITYAGSNDSVVAYAQNNVSYSSGTDVYVYTVDDQNTYNKIIIGKVNPSTNHSNEDEDGAAIYSLSDYIILGGALTDESLSLYKDDIVGFNLRARIITNFSDEDKILRNKNYGIEVKFNNEENFILDTYNMTGDPYNYSALRPDVKTGGCVQSAVIIPNNIKTITAIEEISAFYGDAEGSVIIEDIKLYPIGDSFTKNNKYNLKVYSYDNPVETETVEVKAELTYDKYTDLTSDCKFIWGLQNPSIDNTSNFYNEYLGKGWQVLKDNDNSTISFMSNLFYTSSRQVKCVAIADDKTRLSGTTTIYSSNGLKCSLATSDGTNIFNFNTNNSTSKTINVLFENNNSNVAKVFTWNLYNQNDSSPIVLKEDTSTLKLLDTQVGDNNEYVIIECVIQDSSGMLIASPTIKLFNQVSAYDNCYIELSNDYQVFEYSRAGLSPASETMQTPITLYDITPTLYDKDGNTISSDNYSVYWIVPKTNTLLNEPTQNISIVLDNNDYVYSYEGKFYPLSSFGIVDDYNIDYTNNQITCVITYNGNTYRKSTNFIFSKQGDSGTSYSQYTLRIKPPLGTESSTLYPMLMLDSNNNKLGWSCGQDELIDATSPMQTVYYDNRTKSQTSVEWSVANNTAEIDENGLLDFSESENLITFINAVASEELNDTYPLPIVKYEEGYDFSDCEISLNKSGTVKYIKYNSDGRNPEVSTNIGVSLNISSKYKIIWTVSGTKDTSKQIPHIKISPYYMEFNDSRNNYSSVSIRYDSTSSKDNAGNILYIYNNIIDSMSDASAYVKAQLSSINGQILNKIKSSDTDIKDLIDGTPQSSDQGVVFKVNWNLIYNMITSDSDNLEALKDIIGSSTTGILYVSANPSVFYLNADDGLVGEVMYGSKKIATIYIPIYLYYESYLSIIDGWDGKSVSVGDSTVMTPLLGAGKIDNGKFYGIALGQKGLIDGDSITTGIYGYANVNGQQKSTFEIDATTGNIYLGTSNKTNFNDDDTLISLIPGGESSISGWRMTNSGLYKTADNTEYSGSFSRGQMGIMLHSGSTNEDIPYIEIHGKNNCIKLDPSQDGILGIYGYDSDTATTEKMIGGINKEGRFFSGSIADGNTELYCGDIDDDTKNGIVLETGNSPAVSLFKDETAKIIYLNSGKTTVSRTDEQGKTTETETTFPLSINASKITLTGEIEKNDSLIEAVYQAMKDILQVDDSSMSKEEDDETKTITLTCVGLGGDEGYSDGTYEADGMTFYNLSFEEV